MFVTYRTATSESPYEAVLGATGVDQFAWSTSCDVDWSVIDNSTMPTRNAAACDSAYGSSSGAMTAATVAACSAQYQRLPPGITLNETTCTVSGVAGSTAAYPSWCVSTNPELGDYNTLCPERYFFVVTVFRGSPDGLTIKNASIEYELAV
jgi:hypothetical protein